MPDDAALSPPEPIFTLLRVVSGSQGAGTDDDVLIEILASRTGEQIKDIVKVYKKGRGGKQKHRTAFNDSEHFYFPFMHDTCWFGCCRIRSLM